MSLIPILVYINAIKDDPSGREAVNIFIRNHPLVANRTFVDLVANVLLHAPTIISSTSSLGYSNALATTTVATALAAAPTDKSALKQQIAKLQKDLAATHNRTKGPPRAHESAPAKTGALHYCWAHGYQYSHLGSTCKVMLNDKKYRKLPRTLRTPPEGTRLSRVDGLVTASGQERRSIVQSEISP